MDNPEQMLEVFKKTLESLKSRNELLQLQLHKAIRTADVYESLMEDELRKSESLKKENKNLQKEILEVESQLKQFLKK